MCIRDSPITVTLIEPKVELTFDQLLNAVRQVTGLVATPTLLIADGLNPKYRPLLVRYEVPFIYKDESIFAPELALKFSRLRSYRDRSRIEGLVAGDELHPLSVKLLAAYLSRHIQGRTTLQSLHWNLGQAGATLSLAKLSQVVSELVRLEYARAIGSGPKKEFALAEPAQVWTMLLTARMAPSMRVVHDYYWPNNTEDFVLSGESALAEYSDLASPTAKTIATTPEGFRKMRVDHTPVGDFGGPGIFIQIWKENPKVFSFNGILNPIELYFSMKNNLDERVQSSLEYMLSKYGFSLPEGK